MTRYLKLAMLYALLLALVWLVSSLYLSKKTTQALDDILSDWSGSSAQYIAGVEVLSTDKGMFSSQRTVQVTPSVPHVFEQLGDFTLNIQQKSGPLIFDDQGLRFGRAEWTIGLVGNEFSDEAHVQFKITNDFFEQLQVLGEVNQLNGQSWTSNDLTVQGVVNLSEESYQFVSVGKAVNIYVEGVHLKLADTRLEVASAPTSDNAAGSLIKIDINAGNSRLINEKNGKNIPLNVSSTTSIWKNNDTLDADFKVSFVNTLPLDRKEAYLAVQLRQWLTSGASVYFEQLLNSSHLLRQAEWALEEVETPEQQDFYRSLIYQAGNVDRLQWTDIVTPMLKSGQSQIAVDAGFKQSTQQLAQLRLSGSAKGLKSGLNLPLSGNINVATSQLDDKIMKLLKRWAGRGSLREYETSFESDLAIQEQEFLLNNGRVSLVRLKDELMRALTDQ